MKKKVFIIGSGSTRLKTPWETDGEIWFVGSVITFDDCKRCDAVFELHDREAFEKNINRLNKSGAIVYMKEHQEDIPQSVAFPIDSIVDEFGNYLTNTVSYMLAFAMQQGYEEINLFGVHMIQDSEYGYQKPSCEYFIGLARGKGIEVNICEGSELLYSPALYGYQKHDNELKKTLNAKIKWYNDNAQDSDRKRKEWEKVIHQSNGGMKVIDALLSKYTEEPIKSDLLERKKLYEQFKKDFEKNLTDMHNTWQQNIGASAALKYLIKCGY